jgi:hypothetical protein
MIKVFVSKCRKPVHEKRDSLRIIPGSPLHQEAQALSLSVALVRKVQGKKNPADFPVDSPEWHRMW